MPSSWPGKGFAGSGHRGAEGLWTFGPLKHMPPTPDEQIAFLTKVQRILSEGQFTATYKYALLLALADLAVEVGDDSALLS